MKVDGRRLVILFHLFGGKTLRFSDLARAIPGISQKMLTQQLRQLEGDGIVTRNVHAEVPPKVEYHLTEWGQSLCPALDRLLMIQAEVLVGEQLRNTSPLWLCTLDGRRWRVTPDPTFDRGFDEGLRA